MEGFKKFLAVTALVAALVCIAWALRPRPRLQARAPAAAPAPFAKIDSLKKSVPAGAVKSSSARLPAAAARPDVQAGLAGMTRTLFQFTRPGRPLKDLVEFLDQTRQGPVTTHNSNADTGEMAIVRTRRPLPGTRYFHAQYFSAANGEEGFVQHMSFEYQPGPTALEDAIESVRHTFSLPEPQVRREDYARWSLEGGRILWVKRLALDDLKDDPFNAYTRNDVGTIRVAIEAEIH